jgi:hypothetical protein
MDNGYTPACSAGHDGDFEERQVRGVVEAAGKVGAVVEKVGDVNRISYVDRFMDKEEVVGRMLSALTYLLVRGEGELLLHRI